ncbi:hypothetical protein NDU88_000053 [Pleurodeles waltl]|uniref:Uncharacterized protein n=1 Tax=Pleurodeles waltl TaxID=8319 RepID=A0AAV7KPG2_PLEWA|nr:hypothetical protein NDU88_000053 [Pleurodeles waltl]
MRCGAGEAGVQASDARRALSDTETQSSRTYEAWLGGELDPIDIGLAVHRRVRGQMRCGAGEAGVQASDARRALSDTETQSSRTYEAWLGGELDPIDIGLAVHRRVR